MRIKPGTGHLKSSVLTTKLCSTPDEVRVRVRCGGSLVNCGGSLVSCGGSLVRCGGLLVMLWLISEVCWLISKAHQTVVQGPGFKSGISPTYSLLLSTGELSPEMVIGHSLSSGRR